jgi:hypothetical protein
VKKWGFFHIYYYIVLQYTPSILISFYIRKNTLKLLVPNEGEEEAVIVVNPIIRVVD